MDPTTDKDAKVAEREAVKLAKRADDLLVIKNDDQLKNATELLAEVKRIEKNIKSKKDPIVKNLNATLRQVRDLFRPSEDRLAAVQSQLKGAILTYHDKVEQAALKKAEKIEEKVDSGEMGLAQGMGKLDKIKQAPTQVKVDNGGVQIRTVRKVRITNVGQLPASYFMRERVVEALRMEVANDVLKLGKDVPKGAELYEEKVAAGV